MSRCTFVRHESPSRARPQSSPPSRDWRPYARHQDRLCVASGKDVPPLMLMFAPSITMMRYHEFLVHTSSDVNGGSLAVVHARRQWRWRLRSLPCHGYRVRTRIQSGGVLVRRLCLDSSEDAGAAADEARDRRHRRREAAGGRGQGSRAKLPPYVPGAHTPRCPAWMARRRRCRSRTLRRQAKPTPVTRDDKVAGYGATAADARGCTRRSDLPAARSTAAPSRKNAMFE